MIFRFAAESEPRTSAVNLSMLARTASIPGSRGSNTSTGSGPNFGGMITSQPALRSKSSAPAPTSPSVLAVIRTFHDIGASLSEGRGDSMETASHLQHWLSLRLGRPDSLAAFDLDADDSRMNAK